MRAAFLFGSLRAKQKMQGKWLRKKRGFRSDRFFGLGQASSLLAKQEMQGNLRAKRVFRSDRFFGLGQVGSLLAEQEMQGK
jgi:hypothetical protein